VDFLADDFHESPFLYHGVTTIRLPKFSDLVCQRALFLQGSLAKETQPFRKPTNRCHIII